MAAVLNRQPVFTATPILKSLTFDPQVLDKFFTTTRASLIYQDDTTYGSLITKITVNSTGRVGSIVSAKRIYLLVQDSEDTNAYNVFKSEDMREVSISNANIDFPYVEFTFDGGLLTSRNTKLAIAATTNLDTTGEDGDRLTVVIEGGTYDQPA